MGAYYNIDKDAAYYKLDHPDESSQQAYSQAWDTWRADYKSSLKAGEQYSNVMSWAIGGGEAVGGIRVVAGTTRWIVARGATKLITKRLAGHMEDAVAQATLTPRQLAAVGRNPDTFDMHMGTQIDTLFKENVSNDALLQWGKVKITPRYKFGPDAYHRGLNTWWDVTTQRAWPSHVVKYGQTFGNGIPLTYK